METVKFIIRSHHFKSRRSRPIADVCLICWPFEPQEDKRWPKIRCIKIENFSQTKTDCLTVIIQKISFFDNFSASLYSLKLKTVEGFSMIFEIRISNFWSGSVAMSQNVIRRERLRGRRGTSEWEVPDLNHQTTSRLPSWWITSEVWIPFSKVSMTANLFNNKVTAFQVTARPPKCRRGSDALYERWWCIS